VTDRERNHAVSASEVARWMERHERESTQTHRDLTRMIAKLDERTDKLSTRIAIIFAVVAVLWSIFLVIAPVLRGLLGLTSGG